jgi:hypothetical protein
VDCGPAAGDSGLASVAAGPSAASSAVSTGPTAPGGSLPSMFVVTVGSPRVETEVMAPVVPWSVSPPPQPARTSPTAASAIQTNFMDASLRTSGSVGLAF